MSLLDYNFWIFLQPCIWTCHILFPTLLVYLALLILLFHPTPLFGPIFYEIYIQYPPYSFIWPYSFNWHLRVVTFSKFPLILPKRSRISLSLCIWVTKIPRAMKIHKLVIQIAFVMHREENDCVILAFDAKYKFSFSISSILNYLSFDLYRRFQDSPVGSKKGHDVI